MYTETFVLYITYSSMTQSPRFSPIEYCIAIKGVAVIEGSAHEDLGDVFYYQSTLVMSRFSEDRM